jgi:hypothetical protein
MRNDTDHYLFGKVSFAGATGTFFTAAKQGACTALIAVPGLALRALIDPGIRFCAAAIRVGTASVLFHRWHFPMLKQYNAVARTRSRAPARKRARPMLLHRFQQTNALSLKTGSQPSGRRDSSACHLLMRQRMAVEPQIVQYVVFPIMPVVAARVRIPEMVNASVLQGLV